MPIFFLMFTDLIRVSLVIEVALTHCKVCSHIDFRGSTMKFNTHGIHHICQYTIHERLTLVLGFLTFSRLQCHRQKKVVQGTVEEQISSISIFNERYSNNNNIVVVVLLCLQQQYSAVLLCCVGVGLVAVSFLLYYNQLIELT